MNKIKIVIVIVLTMVFKSFSKIVNAQEKNTITMTFYVYHFEDLYGYQIDVKNQPEYFSINMTDSSKPYFLTTNNLFSETDQEWINNYNSDIATVIYTRGLEETVGYTDDYFKLISISMTANADITNIHDLFIVSNDYNDLEYGNANVILKLSNSNSESIEYHYNIDFTAPLINNLKDYSIKLGDSIPDILSKLNILDNYDNNPIINIDYHNLVDTNTIGDYKVTIEAIDIFGNIIIEEITITIVDFEKPIITLNGESEITIEAGNVYHKLGTIVTDNYDMDLEVNIDGDVNSNQVGDYVLKYQAIDNSGNLAIEVIRTVHVIFGRS